MQLNCFLADAQLQRNFLVWLSQRKQAQHFRLTLSQFFWALPRPALPDQLVGDLRQTAPVPPPLP